MSKSSVIRRSLVDQVYGIILEKIQSGEYTQGTRLNIEELSKECGVSRTPVREAISRLVQNGFVVNSHNIGPRVAEYSLSRLEELCIANTILFDSIIPLIPEENLSGLARELTETVNKQQQAFEDNDLEKFSEYAILFHEKIIKACPNSLLSSYTLNTQIQLDIFVTMYHKDETIRKLSIAEHQSIANALLDNDIQGFQEAMHIHNMKPVGFFEDTQQNV